MAPSPEVSDAGPGPVAPAEAVESDAGEVEAVGPEDRAAGDGAGAEKVDCRKRKCLALTFDDGPGPYTRDLLRVLRKAEVRVTFFVVGPRARTREGVLALAHADGHQIGVHTENHLELTKLSDSRIHREIDRTLRTIRTQTGERPVLLRPPYGATNPRVAAQARRLKVAQILWDVDPVDWRDRDTAVVTRRVIAGFHRGAIILMHDIHPTTVAAVPRVLKAAEAKGYTLVTVSELLGTTKPGKVYTDARP
ncbi:polysaccharide deacetylase family protein [Actinocorallia herbida]|uniref:polysaccharide deacetylase family protein n=1 Tax=Actinocorallia herbida TaxID=58109 RepID=UPI001FECC4CE|nr:polysaccharide deacetylase family protein [Actinocorallia herbida]